MTLVNFVAFVVFKILDNLVFMRIFNIIFLMQTVGISKISRTFQHDLTFNLDTLLESSIGFVYFSLVLTAK